MENNKRSAIEKILFGLMFVLLFIIILDLGHRTNLGFLGIIEILFIVLLIGMIFSIYNDESQSKGSQIRKSSKKTA